MAALGSQLGAGCPLPCPALPCPAPPHTHTGGLRLLALLGACSAVMTVVVVEVAASWLSAEGGLRLVSSSLSSARPPSSCRAAPKSPVTSGPGDTAWGVTGCARKGEICSGEWLVTPCPPLLPAHEVSSGSSSPATVAASPPGAGRCSAEKKGPALGGLGWAALGLWGFLAAALPCLSGAPAFLLGGGSGLVGAEVGSGRRSLCAGEVWAGE